MVALIATQMRRILVDDARAGSQQDGDVLAIDEALTALEAVDARASKVVELRFFAGLAEAEAAQTLGVPVATIKRDWTFARAWLHDRLTAKDQS
jgi:DNA-directed RNA polymerase specialized sigma24 family protein